ncbi:MAG TPA: hypothetical protein ENI80_00745 [Acidiferrobacteraceae bacterium]|nr:hypothetical protein [Acidiferrobacteraceae bacterium]
MLDHILRQVQGFERRHGYRPNVVFINRRHYRVLRHNYPNLFQADPSIELGFRIAVVSEDLMSQPEALFLRPPPQAA